jgi:hypothetical protein
MALKKRREKWVTHKTEEGGTIVTFDRWCCDIDKGDIPGNTFKIIIPDDTKLGYISEGAFPKRVVKRLIKSGAVTEYERGYYLGTSKNPYFMLLDFLHREYRDGTCFVYGGDKIHPDCQVVRPSAITDFAAWRREERHGAVSLKNLIDVLKENKDALTLENGGGAWSTSSDGKLLGSDGNVVADLDDELKIFVFWLHGGMFWNKKSELYPVGHLGALGYRFAKIMKRDMGIYTYVSTKKKGTEDDRQDIGQLDMTASCKIFNWVLNHGDCFDAECG